MKKNLQPKANQGGQSLPLHLRHRPEFLDHVIGHSSVIRSLKKIIVDDACHAFLFGGPPGVGKTTLARLVAKALSCSKIEIDAATHSGADHVRDLLEGLIVKPLGEDHVAVIIDEAHALSKQAFQALLKTMEEPPDWLYWFLCTSEINKVPVAIKRRCASYELRLISTALIGELLYSVCLKDKLVIPTAIVNLCADEAQGSPGRALMNLTACLGAKDLDDARAVLRSSAGSVAAIDLARALFQGVDWRDLQALLRKLKEENPESVRHVVQAYMTTILLSKPGMTQRAKIVLKAFSQPFNGSDGISPLVLAVMTVCSNS